ncbi:MAG: tautomerase family protein [Anaerolineae bacterium]
MPIVQVQVWQGFGEDRARRLIEGITSSFEGVGVPAGAVQVIIQEIPRTHWGVGGQVSSDRPGQGGDSDGRSGRPREYRPQHNERSDRPPREDRSDRTGGYRSPRDGGDDRQPRGDRPERPGGYRPRSQERTEQPERGQRPARPWQDRSRGPSGPGRSERTERSDRRTRADSRPRPDSRPGSRPRRGSGGGSSSSRP